MENKDNFAAREFVLKSLTEQIISLEEKLKKLRLDREERMKQQGHVINL